MLLWKDFIMTVILVQHVLLSAVLFFVLLLVPKVSVSCSLRLRSCLGLAQKLKPDLLTRHSQHVARLALGRLTAMLMTVTEAVLSNSTKAESCNRCEKRYPELCIRCENNNGYLLLICLKARVSCSAEELHQMIHQHMESFIKYTCMSITNSS